jgi:hypothetical protein
VSAPEPGPSAPRLPPQESLHLGLAEAATDLLCRAGERAAAAADAARAGAAEAGASAAAAQAAPLIGALLRVVAACTGAVSSCGGGNGAFRVSSGGGAGSRHTITSASATGPTTAPQTPSPELLALGARAAAALHGLADAATAAPAEDAPAAPPGAAYGRETSGGSAAPPACDLERWLSGSLRVRTGREGEGDAGDAGDAGSGGALQERTLAEAGDTAADGGCQQTQHAAGTAAIQADAGGWAPRSASGRRVTFDPAGPALAGSSSDDHSAAGDASAMALSEGGSNRQGSRRGSGNGGRSAAELLRSGGSSLGRASRGSGGEPVLSPSGKEMAAAGIRRRLWLDEGAEAAAPGGEGESSEDDCGEGLAGAAPAATGTGAAAARAALLAAWQGRAGELASAAVPLAAAAAGAAAVAARAAGRASDAGSVHSAQLAQQLDLLRSISPRRAGAGSSSCGGGGGGGIGGGARAGAGASPGRHRGARYARPPGGGVFGVEPHSGGGAWGSGGGAVVPGKEAVGAAPRLTGLSVEAAVEAAAHLMEALAALARDER